MLVGWYVIPEDNFALQSEVAFEPCLNPDLLQSQQRASHGA